jgi:hypothetical protein
VFSIASGGSFVVTSATGDTVESPGALEQE